MAVQTSEATLSENFEQKASIVELEQDDSPRATDHDSYDLDGVPFPGKYHASNLPLYLQPTILNLFHSELETVTSEVQAKIAADCLPYLTGKDTQGLPLNSYGLPHLHRQAHADYLRGFLGDLPAGYAAMDASRPWLFYWCIAGLSFLGEDINDYRARLMETVSPLQNPDGGFGGGHGQLSHCACSYATVLALTTVHGLEVVNRRTMWAWLGQIKQADGGFRMALDAEEDIRGAYCAMTIITLLNLPLELPFNAPARAAGLTTFTDRLGEWIGRCQTFEGGIGGAPTNEAHGAYAFCALACLNILDAPHRSIPRWLDTNALLRWLASVQTVSEGGFAGRTNKLVDACYSHWVGGCWSLLRAALHPTTGDISSEGRTNRHAEEPGDEVWNPPALVRYLLACCQQPGKKGGMRDKPSARPDAYHTCYSLSGLSAAQHAYRYNVHGQTECPESQRLTAAFNWRVGEPSFRHMRTLKVDREDVVKPVHPVFVLSFEAVEHARKQFESGGF